MQITIPNTRNPYGKDSDDESEDENIPLWKRHREPFQLQPIKLLEPKTFPRPILMNNSYTTLDQEENETSEETEESQSYERLKKTNQDKVNEIFARKKSSKKEEIASPENGEDRLVRLLSKKNPKKEKTLPKKMPEMNLEGEIKLENTFFESVGNNGKIFLYSNNKLFALTNEERREEHCFLRYKGIDFTIEPQEEMELKKLESDFLEKNRENIEEFQKTNLQRLSQEYSSYREKIIGLRDSMKKRFTMERFISNYVFGWYKERNKVKESNGDLKNIKVPEEKLEDSVKIPEVNFSDAKDPILEEIVRDFEENKKDKFGGIVIMLGGVYSLPKVTKENGKNRVIDFENCKYLVSTSEFNNRYKEKLRQEIKKRVSKNLSEGFEKLNECKSSAESIKPQKEEEIKHKEGDLGFYKDEKDYIVFLEFPEFIIEKNKKFYYLPSGRIESRLSRENGSIILDEHIYAFTNGKQRYDHLFVFSDSRVCLHGDRSREIGITKYRHDLRSLDKEELARNIIDFLEIGKVVLTQGYTGTHRGADTDALDDKKISPEEAQRKERSGIEIYQNGGKIPKC